MLRILLIKKDESKKTKNFKALNIIGKQWDELWSQMSFLMFFLNQHANEVIDIFWKQQKREYIFRFTDVFKLEK